MTGLSSAGESAVLAPLVATAFVSLHTGDPGPTGVNEVSGGGYARQGPVAFVEAGSEPTVASNSAIVSFPQATADWGFLIYFGVWDAVAAGNFLGSGALTAASSINNGDDARFFVGALTITVQ